MTTCGLTTQPLLDVPASDGCPDGPATDPQLTSSMEFLAASNSTSCRALQAIAFCGQARQQRHNKQFGVQFEACGKRVGVTGTARIVGHPAGCKDDKSVV